MNKRILYTIFIGIITFNQLTFSENINTKEINSKADVNKRIEMLEDMEMEVEKLTNIDKEKLDRLKEKYKHLKEKYKDIDIKDYKEKLEFLNFEKESYKDILKDLEKAQENIKSHIEKGGEKDN